MENSAIPLSFFLDNYETFRFKEIKGRYIPYGHIENILSKISDYYPVEVLGTSTLENPVQAITIGTGEIKILAWSQMHGNESTTTKAVLDLINCLIHYREKPFIVWLLKKITLKVIPMLNPDGAQLYTRENANKIDLNRDALNLQEKESKLLKKVFTNFSPNFCFNLHDQRTIFSVGEEPSPATLSFLTPSMNNSREIFPSRTISMKVIAAIACDLQEFIPNQIGRYDDSYNPNCTGDNFQSAEVPTILFEAGHYFGDYNREQTRKYVIIALFSALKSVATGEWHNKKTEEYFKIPENRKLFYDVILRNAIIDGNKMDIGIQFKETLKNEYIEFVPLIEKIEPFLPFYGHKEIDCEEHIVTQENQKPLSENVIVHKLLVNNEVLAINYQIIYK